MLTIPLALLTLGSGADDAIVFETTQLSDAFLCEGASFGDLDRDGVNDVVAGPFWYRGPDFRSARRLYDGQPFDPAGYSDHFFSWVRDLDGDGWSDVFFIGFPGQEAFWLRNPAGGEGPWVRHLVHDNVDNESPWFVDLNGDGLEDLVCSSQGALCWLERDPADPAARWRRHDISENLDLQRFTHGMGVGDVDGDGRKDVLLNVGWWEQPDDLAGDPLWKHHPFTFSSGQGGAQMLVHDFDGDGDADVVTSLNAHRYGLSWFEQVKPEEGGLTFREHKVMGSSPGKYGCPLAVSELHALDLADVDGDGRMDVVSGKRFMSHGLSEGGATDPAELFWLRSVPDGKSVRFVAHRVHSDSGVGTQVMAGDVDGDDLTDVVMANKKGAFVHLQRRRDAPDPQDGDGERLEELVSDWPFPPGGHRPRSPQGAELDLGLESGSLAGWEAEGEAFADQPIEGDTVLARRGDMESDHAGGWWIGGYERHGDSPAGTLTSPVFRLDAPWVTFLVAGGATADTRVDLVRARDGARLASAAGRNHESLRPVVLDLAAHVGEDVRLRLVDASSGGWGHLNFDDLRLYPERPAFPDGFEVEGTVDVVEHAGLLPEEAARAMTVPEGFQVDLVAGEPDLHQPIAFTLDARGRLWVAEAHSYPVRRAPEDAIDKILIFEDADGDGRFEGRKVFIEGLNLVSGLELGYGGVFVGAAPELLFIPDRDGDDVPDGPPEVLLDGWGYQDTHETLNAFIWGPDGWLYGCHGVFTHSKVGPPLAPDDERVKLNAAVWRYHPTRRSFEVFAEGSSNPWGVDFDDYGAAYITACVIPHLYHLSQGGRYVRQAGSHFNPYVYEDIPTIADHLHYVGDTPHSGNGVSNAVGGGHAHCGAMIYLADAFPERYRGTLFVSNIHGNRINNEILVPHRSGAIGMHGDDFLLANDQWFRGINLHYGPQGEVYLIDWYDAQACHYVTEDVWNRTNGRLYRVTWGEPRKGTVDLAAMGEKELVEQALSPNDWYVRTARRLLAERGISDEGRARLREILFEHEDATRRLRALWALSGAGALAPELALAVLADADPHVRAWAVQLACEQGAPTRRFLGEMERLALTDPSPVVRLYLACALQRLPLAHRWGIAEALATHGEDADDANVPYLLWYGVEPLVPSAPERALTLARTTAIPRLAGWILRRAAEDERGRDVLARSLARERDGARRSAILDGMLAALGRRRGVAMPAAWSAAYPSLASEDALRERALVLAAVFGDAQAFPALRERIADAGLGQEERELALDALVRGRDEGGVRAITGLLADAALRGPALRALGAFDAPEIPAAILAAWPALGEGERHDAVATLTSRAPGALALLDAIGSELVPRAALGAFELRKLADLGDEKVTARLAEVWGVAREVLPDAASEIEAWKGRLPGERLAGADLSHGRDVFARTCQRCHTLYGEGQDIGPDLTGSNRADLDYLLQNMVDPNAIIPNEYRVTIVRTTDGRVVTGIAQGETADALTLRTETELLTLGLDEIDARREDPNSMMPVGQLGTLSEDEVAALVAYLRHDRQVPRRLTADNVAAFFDGKSLAGWRGDAALWSVEDGVIVGRSPGLARNEFLKSDFELGDFRLVLEVRLVPNEGNGGVQLRSRALDDGEVAGLQADLGAGWWGKLYDEQGRGLLVGDDRDALVRGGEWNTYEILAVGDRVRTTLNGKPCVDFTDPEGPRRGIVAFQLHSGGAFEISYRIVSLELDPALPDSGAASSAGPSDAGR